MDVGRGSSFQDFTVTARGATRRKKRRGRVGGGKKSSPGEKRWSPGRGWKVHDQSLYFEITYFSISLINGAGLAARQKQGP